MLTVKDHSHFGNKRLRKMLLGASFVLFLFIFGVAGISFPTPATQTAEAQTVDHNFRGYAFSYGVGWISFSCHNLEECDSSNYGVNYNEVSGAIEGYAWSPSIGWIQFGDLSDFPTVDGIEINAEIDRSGQLIGWARACAGTVNGDCSTMESRTDGWDGWILLSGTWIDGAQLNTDTGAISGWSYGHNVVGWIDWDAASSLDCDGSPCGEGSSGGVSIIDPFQFRLDAPGIQLTREQSMDARVTIERIEGTAEDVVLDYINPLGTTGITISGLRTESCNPGSNSCQVDFTVTAASDAPVGLTQVQISGESATYSETTNFAVNVAGEFDGTVSCSANRAVVIAGTPVTWSAVVNGGSSYSYSWGGDVSGSSENVTITYSDAGIKTVTVTVTDTVSLGTVECEAEIRVKSRGTINEV